MASRVGAVGAAARAARYRRRRLAAMFVAGAVMAGGEGLVSLVHRAAEAPRRAELVVRRVYVVQPGDTLWAIAGRLHPGGDPRPTVDRLVARHGRRPLQVGERISL